MEKWGLLFQTSSVVILMFIELYMAVHTIEWQHLFEEDRTKFSLCLFLHEVYFHGMFLVSSFHCRVNPYTSL